jgi:glycerol-3-phosphate cytidylyltransferase
LKVQNKLPPLTTCLIGVKMKIGFTCSAWDLLHAGHVQMLREAKEQCDYLIVGLQTDPTIDRPEKNQPVQTIVERYTQLKGVKYVDEIIPYATEKDLEDILNMYNIDVRILGEEYKEKEFTGKDICRKRGIKLYFNKRDHRFSSSDLRKRVSNREKGYANE